MALPSKVKNINGLALVMLITGAIDSIRNLPATALFGSDLIFYFIFSALVFLIPIALVSAELSASFTEQGGIYYWVKCAFGKNMAFLAIWLQWINTVVWYPTMLSFIAGTMTYLINPSLANNKFYLISIILGVFWILTFINMRGLKTSATFATICTIAGMIIPVTLIITLAMIWIISGKPLQLSIHWSSLVPNFHQSQNWVSLTAIMAAFLGMELATVHVNQINNPNKTFPRAVFISVVIILITMIAGALAIAFVIPAAQINLVDGVVEAFNQYFLSFHLQWLMPVIVAMILIGSIGSMVNWIISPAKGLLQAAKDGYLPKFFTNVNQHDVASTILLVQAILVSLVCVAFLLMPSVNGSYWLLTDLSTQMYVLMYVIMLIAAIVIKFKSPHLSKTFKIPGGQWGMLLVGGVGLIGCLITLVVGFIPPSDINVGTNLHYVLMFSGGLFLMIIPVTFFLQYKKLPVSLAME